jgi:predicted nucleotidyltransferase component of viral defense system
MSRVDLVSGWLHEDVPLYKQALTFTEVQTGFSSLLVEKDYFCTVLLSYLSENPCGLVFKGGTCLAKVMAGFYRLSEDLDFVIPLSLDSGRKKRSRSMEPLRASFSHLNDTYPVFEQVDPLVGANNSTQYIGNVHFRSPVTGYVDRISIEVSLREPLLQSPLEGNAQTIMLDPNTGKSIVPDVSFPCISFAEGFAEKFRAALTRREVAIRDFYDIDYAVRHLGLDVDASDFRELVKAKIAVSGNDPVKLDPERFEELRSQLDGRLKPVLRSDDYQTFDLDRAIRYVEAMAKKVSKSCRVSK